ncbi:MAG TPA: nitrate reductase molybdenum cofactor assembly chaperone [Solirubrobacterales bacterium]|nr:nitrate reductase molybdenum cofactor assembly chaperone [Solirubrobacterales bacterium]
MAPEPVHPLKLASVLLQYPRAETLEAVADLEPAELSPLRGHQAQHISSFLGWYWGQSLAELRAAYVETFDFARQRSLHLTYHLHGDSRQRGLALAKLKEAYAAAGLEGEPGELPDFLPLMLEFCSLAPEPAGRELLDRHRPAIELVRDSLHREASPFVALLDAVVDCLPGLTERQVARIKRLAAEGPPSERVGLEPFAPPEVMPVPGGPPAQPLVGGRE